MRCSGENYNFAVTVARLRPLLYSVSTSPSTKSASISPDPLGGGVALKLRCERAPAAAAVTVGFRRE